MLHDITVPLSSRTVCFPGDEPPCLTRLTEVTGEAELAASRLTIGCHVGTHLDAPAHFVEDGMAVDDLPLETFYGPAKVVDCRSHPIITAELLQSLVLPHRCHILLQTDNSQLLHEPVFQETYTVLSPAGAAYLASLSPLSIGFDYYSLDPFVSHHLFEAHLLLARAGIAVFVCLDFLNIRAGRYFFAGFPLRLQGAEGSPVRALLIDR